MKKILSLIAVLLILLTLLLPFTVSAFTTTLTFSNGCPSYSSNFQDNQEWYFISYKFNGSWYIAQFYNNNSKLPTFIQGDGENFYGFNSSNGNSVTNKLYYGWNDLVNNTSVIKGFYNYLFVGDYSATYYNVMKYSGGLWNNVSFPLYYQPNSEYHIDTTATDIQIKKISDNATVQDVGNSINDIKSIGFNSTTRSDNFFMVKLKPLSDHFKQAGFDYVSTTLHCRIPFDFSKGIEQLSFKCDDFIGTPQYGQFVPNKTGLIYTVDYKKTFIPVIIPLLNVNLNYNDGYYANGGIDWITKDTNNNIGEFTFEFFGQIGYTENHIVEFFLSDYLGNGYKCSQIHNYYANLINSLLALMCCNLFAIVLFYISLSSVIP